MRESKASKEQIEKRRQLLEEHANWVDDIAVAFEEEKEMRMALRDGELEKQDSVTRCIGYLWISLLCYLSFIYMHSY